MKPLEAIQILLQLQNAAIQKGMFADVKAVNRVSMAIAVLENLALEKSTNE